MSNFIAHIVCIDKSKNIGVTDGSTHKMPWGLSIKSDLKHFRNTTKDNVVIMGKNTFNSIGSPLKDRINIVVSSSLEPTEGVIVVPSVEEALEKAKEYDKNIFIIGGKQLYDATHSIIDRAYITVLGVDYSPYPYTKVKSKWSFIKYNTTPLDGFKLFSNTVLKDEDYPYEVIVTEWHRDE